jgi:hypothetical protein
MLKHKNQTNSQEQGTLKQSVGKIHSQWGCKRFQIYPLKF